MIYYSKKQAGFSLVETLVAVSILMIVIVGPMSISMRTAKSSSFATEQVTAFFLAQEGLELAQKGRDDLLLQFRSIPPIITNPWARFIQNPTGQFSDCFNPASGCGLEWATPTTINVIACSSNPCLLYTGGTGRSNFTHSNTGKSTPFTRRIYFRNSDANSIEVRSVVTWRTGSIVADQRVEVSTYLYNI
jgi:type II secretory pathway pseudopilin PulG